MSRTLFPEAQKFLSNAKHVLVASHVCPDGDAIGSTLAMGLLLEQAGHVVSFYNRDPVPYNLQFLPGADRITNTIPGDLDCVVILDCAEPRRVGEALANQLPEHVIVIDHHKTYDPDFAQFYVRETDAAATAELVYEFAQFVGLDITLPIAKNVYCALMTDTGSFRYSNTSRRTFTIAGALIDVGVDAWDMTSHLYESQPRERIALLAKALQSLSYSACGRVAFLTIERRDFDGNPDGALIDGFINFARGVAGVEVAVQLLEGTDGKWFVSFRSKGAVDVSDIASAHGGGGHRNAAGCELSGLPEEMRAQLETTFLELLD